MLNVEFTVVEGAYARRKFWQNYTVVGGKLDEKGQSKDWNISKSAFRAMVDSALGLKPDDLSDAACAKRVPSRMIGGLQQLDGITFAARIMVEVSDNPNYRDANKIANVVLPNEPAYAVIMRGETVPPRGRSMHHRASLQQLCLRLGTRKHRPKVAGQIRHKRMRRRPRPVLLHRRRSPGGAPAWLNS